MNIIIIVHLIIALSLWPFVIIYKLFPPRKINSWYGFRTSRAMKNQKNWDVANRISANMMLAVVILTNIFQFVSYFVMNGEASVLSSTIFLTAAILVTIPLTNKKLKETERERR